MISEIRVDSSSGTKISIGQYNRVKKELTLFVYQTRFKNGDGDIKYAEVRDFDLGPYKDAEVVILSDLDWDYKWSYTLDKFKRIPVMEGVRLVKVDKTNLMM